MADLYTYSDYRTYLNAALPTKGKGRGRRALLAEALSCHNGFVSLVLGGGGHFSLEHAEKISRFLDHSEEERDYFLLLVHRARAGSKDLERYYQAKIDTILRSRREIRERIQVKSTLSEQDQLIYYSSWHYLGVHMCLYAPEYRDRAVLARRLGLSAPRVSEVLRFLIRAGLVEERDGMLNPLPSRTHLPSDSPLVAKHHTNWRMKAVQSLDQGGPADLHYSAVFSLSEGAAEKIRSILLSSFQQMEPILKEAKDEVVYVLGVDLFKL